MDKTVNLDINFPRVSVVMSVHNAEKYLREAVDSILAQTFTDFEFIIIDDGSTDTTPKILDGYSDPRIIRKRNEQNIGYTPSLNWGITAASGEFIARMDADDISLPDRLAVQVDFLESHPTIDVLGAGYRKIDEKGTLTSSDVLPPDNPIFIKWLLLFQNTLAHPSVMFRKKVYKKSGGYDPFLVPAEDYDLWQRLSQYTMISNVRKVLILYRKHEKNISKTQANLQQELDILISQRAISTLVGLQVSYDDVRGMRKLSNENPRRYTDLLMLSLNRFKDNHHLTALEKKLVHQDAANRILSISKHRWRDLYFLRYIIKACLLNPSLVDYLFKSFKRKVGIPA